MMYNATIYGVDKNGNKQFLLGLKATDPELLRKITNSPGNIDDNFEKIVVESNLPAEEKEGSKEPADPKKTDDPKKPKDGKPSDKS